MSESRVALVTGAARGLGVEISRQLLESGLRVCVSARQEERGREVCERLGDKNAFPLELDVSSQVSVESAVKKLVERTGRIDVLVNNAGVNMDGTQKPSAADLAIAQKTLDVNLLGSWRMSMAVVPYMVSAGYGRIVNISGNLGSLENMTKSHKPAYRMSKVAVNALTRVLAAELAGTGVLVNSATPGWIRTDMGGPRAPRGVEEGADTPVWLATLPEGSGTTGGFFFDRQPLPW